MARVAIGIVLGVTFGAVIYIIFFAAPSFGRMERSFYRNYEHMAVVLDFLEEQKYYDIAIRRIDREFKMLTSYEWYPIPIEDKTVIASLDELRRQGVREIYYSPGVTFFVKWHSLIEAGSSRGIVYFADGYKSVYYWDRIVFLVGLEPLSEDGWYVYTKNIEEWFGRILLGWSNSPRGQICLHTS